MHTGKNYLDTGTGLWYYNRGPHWGRGPVKQNTFTPTPRPTPIRQKGNTMEKNTNTTTTATTTFADLLRAYENAHATGTDTTDSLLALAVACTQSVLKKCADPQRKAATTREAVSNSGLSPAMVALQRGIVEDYGRPGTPGQLAALRDAMAAATVLKFTEDGYRTEVADRAAKAAADTLAEDTLSDGGDMVNAAVVAILEQTESHAIPGEAWMEKPYTLRRLSRHVLIKSEDAAAWEEVQTTPIQEVYRAIRREVQNSRAVQTDPRNGYLYIEEIATDPESNAADFVYRRLGKWADLGGYVTTGHLDAHGNARPGAYTADAQAAADYDSIIAALNLTDRQARVVTLRMRGYGSTAIGTYLGIDAGHVRRTLRQVQTKCEKIGFTVEMWAEMTAEK